jgi:predicted negative regulator of RcsB-dependent stress response
MAPATRRTSGRFARKFLLIPLAAASACAPLNKQVYTRDEIFQTVSARASDATIAELVVPFEIDPEIREMALKVTDGMKGDREKTHALVSAIIGKTGLSISYDSHSNKTAQEVFRAGKGNCLAYTNLFVGMAREVGLKAVYVDVVTIEKISKEAEVIVNNGHITAGVYYGPQLVMIDFTRTPEREYGGFKVIDDLEAIANYYNNQGFLFGYFTQKQDSFDPLEEELKMYRMALEVFPDFHRARNNLGVALKRRGLIDQAIGEYKRAIQIDPNFAEAHSNLASAYYALGRTEEAIKEFEIAARAAGSNAYFYHHLGIIQYQQGEYRKAIEEFKKALSKKKDLADAMYYLGECFLALKDKAAAIRHYERTLEIDPNYLSARAKLDLLNGELSKQSSR